MNSINTKLNRAAKYIFERYSIDDVVLFGSYMKGKENPADIDVLIVFIGKVDKKAESEFKHKAMVEMLDVNSVTLKELEGEGFVAKEGLYLEGRSLVKNRLLSESMGFSSFAIVKYDISNITGSNRVRFYYALQGRNGKDGFLKSVGGKRFSDNAILCSYASIEKIKLFFEYWKIEHDIVPMLVPSRLKKVMMN